MRQVWLVSTVWSYVSCGYPYDCSLTLGGYILVP